MSNFFVSVSLVPSVTEKLRYVNTRTFSGDSAINAYLTLSQFIQELLNSPELKGSNPEASPQLSWPLVNEYDLTMPINPNGSQLQCTLVDLPAFEDTNVYSQAETLRESINYLSTR
jgi:uncharacterized protein (DUF934 family)